MAGRRLGRCRGFPSRTISRRQSTAVPLDRPVSFCMSAARSAKRIDVLLDVSPVAVRRRKRRRDLRLVQIGGTPPSGPRPNPRQIRSPGIGDAIRQARGSDRGKPLRNFYRSIRRLRTGGERGPPKAFGLR